MQCLLEVRTLTNLVGSAFGRAVLIKVVLFAAIVALGAVNRRRLLPPLAAAAATARRPNGQASCSAARSPPSSPLGAAALAVAGALAGYAPSVAESTGPFSARTDIGPARLELTGDPARVGPNEMHVTCPTAATDANTTPRRS